MNNTYCVISLLSVLCLTVGCKKKEVIGPTNPPNYEVTTFAGNGTVGSADEVGTQASFGALWAITTDAAGNVFVADAGNNSVRKITPQGLVSTIPDYASFTGYYANPLGIALGQGDIVYISYSEGAIIRGIMPTGYGSVFAGDGADDGGKSGLGTSASVGQCFGLATDASGDIYAGITNCVLKITPQGFVTKLAGNGKAGLVDGPGLLAEFNEPLGVATDKAGNVYVADSGNNAIRKITSDGMVSTLAGNGKSGLINGAAPTAEFFYPSGLAVDQNDNIYIADANNSVIRKITTDGTVSTFAGNGLSKLSNGDAANASFMNPVSLVIDPTGNIFVTDRGANVIRKIALK